VALNKVNSAQHGNVYPPKYPCPWTKSEYQNLSGTSLKTRVYPRCRETGYEVVGQGIPVDKV